MAKKKKLVSALLRAHTLACDLVSLFRHCHVVATDRLLVHASTVVVLSLQKDKSTVNACTESLSPSDLRKGRLRSGSQMIANFFTTVRHFAHRCSQRYAHRR